MLGAVAVVNVPVQDENPQRLMAGREALSIARRQRRRVEEAEATCLVYLSVVTWRPDNGHSVSHLHSDKNTSREEMSET